MVTEERDVPLFNTRHAKNRGKSAGPWSSGSVHTLLVRGPGFEHGCGVLMSSNENEMAICVCPDFPGSTFLDSLYPSWGAPGRRRNIPDFGTRLCLLPSPLITRVRMCDQEGRGGGTT